MKFKEWAKEYIGIVILGIVALSAVWVHNTRDSEYSSHTSSYVSIDTSRSSFITNAEYNPETDHLILGLNGRSYEYCGVDDEVWMDFSNSSSLGTYYNEMIKGSYYCD